MRGSRRRSRVGLCGAGVLAVLGLTACGGYAGHRVGFVPDAVNAICVSTGDEHYLQLTLEPVDDRSWLDGLELPGDGVRVDGVGALIAGDGFRPDEDAPSRHALDSLPRDGSTALLRDGSGFREQPLDGGSFELLVAFTAASDIEVSTARVVFTTGEPEWDQSIPLRLDVEQCTPV